MIDDLKNIRKETLVGFFASISEAYNMAIYVFLAPLLAPILFTSESGLRAIIYSYGITFFGSFVAYPLGALYYGSIGDRDGRRKACTNSCLGLAFATGMMGLVPIEIFESSAWAFYLTFVSMQFFFSGGEYHSSVIFSLEHGKDQKQGILSGLSCLSAVLGLVLAKLFSGFAFYDLINWRYLFVIGFIGGMLSFYLKYFCEDTPEFDEYKKENLNSGSYKKFICNYFMPILKSIFVMGYFASVYNFLFVFLPITMPHSFETSTEITIIGLLIYGILLVISGYLSDRFGTSKVMLTGAIGILLTIQPSMQIIKFYPLIAISLMTIFACMFIGPMHNWMLSEFKPFERCRGIMIGSATSSALFSGSAVPILLLIFEQTGSLKASASYIMLLSICVIALLGAAKFQNILSKTGFYKA